MFPCLAFGNGYWWIFPIMMIALMVLCFFIMRGYVGSMMCSPSFGRSGSYSKSAPDSSLDILNRKNAQGETNKQEQQ